MNNVIKFLMGLSMYVCSIQSAQFDKRNSTPCAPPLYTVVAVSVQEDGHDRSFVGIHEVHSKPAQAVSLPVVQVSQPKPTEINHEYHSYLRDVCQCVAVRCSAITGCCGNECRFIGETFDCQDDCYNDCCYANVCFNPCDRMTQIFFDDTRDVRPDVYCCLQDPDHCVTSCVCIPLTLVVAIATAPITIPISWCCR